MDDDGTRHATPDCLNHVEPLARAVTAWATARHDVFGLAVVVGELPPNGRPVMQVEVTFRVDGSPYCLRETFTCTHRRSGGYVCAVLSEKIQAARMKVFANRPTIGQGKPLEKPQPGRRPAQ